MFLPFEGLYAEVINLGMVETLQQNFQVNIAGPSTMAAMLNALQMGFQTLAIQKRSTEVWQVLQQVQTEFDRFADVLQKHRMPCTVQILSWNALSALVLVPFSDS